MFKNTFQSGFLSILYSIGSKPLQIWEKNVNNGHIKRITDNDIQSSVLEIMSSNISTTYITCPVDAQKTLGIKLPFLVMIIKNVRAPSAGCAPLAPAPHMQMRKPPPEHPSKRHIRPRAWVPSAGTDSISCGSTLISMLPPIHHLSMRVTCAVLTYQPHS